MKTKTKTKQYAQEQQSSQKCKQIPCDLPPFCRNNYFTGKLLTERDLTAEQRYAMDKLRLHHVALHGWGIICGLKVRSHPYCPQLKVIVEPGLAIDPCGRFIRVVKETEVELPKPISSPGGGQDPCPPSNEGWYQEPDEGPSPEQQGSYSQNPYANENDASGYGNVGGHPNYGTPAPTRPYQPYQTRNPYQTDTDRPYEPPGYGGYQDHPQSSQPSVDLYFCIAYAECDDEMMPAPFDECACSDTKQKPNRICETYEITVETEEPQGFKDLKHRYECEEEDCLKLLSTPADPCPGPSDLKCLPLAVVKDHTLGEAVNEAQIDNSIRPILHSTQYLEQIIRCVADKLPTKKPTPIVDIGWTHHGEYHCHDFMRQFVGDEHSRRGFQVTFGAPIRAGLNRRTFQAIAVRYTDPSGAGQMEVVPARIRLSDDRLRAYLDIDLRYAQRRLDHTNFDLYLKLRCGHILDDNGVAIDGDLLARLDEGTYVVATPTGDGIPGGVFESWIRVATETRE